MSQYDDTFFAWQVDGALSSAQVIAPLVDKLVAPRTVLDVGCGTGVWAAQWEQGYGIDGHVTAGHLRIPESRFDLQNLATPLVIPESFPERFDLALCLEVAEHLPKRAAKTLVESLCRHSDIVLFSAAVPGQGGTGHINEQWPSWWAKLFAEHGYRPYDLLRDDIWWDQRIEWWYRQNMLIFAKPEKAREHGWVLPRTTKPRSLDLAQAAMVLPELNKMIRATVCIPWRPSPSRMAPFERVQEFWKMFGWPVVTADSDTEVFSLAQARNNAVKKAKTETVVIADADTLIDPLNVVRAAADPAGVWWPFTKYRTIDPCYLGVPISQLASVPWVNTWDGDGMAGVGGCLVTTKKEYFRLGGTPPEFIGWGWEDTAFTVVVRTLSSARRLPGHVYSFEHNTHAEKYLGAKADSPGWDREITQNKHLIKPYIAADLVPWKMRELVARKAAEHAAGVSPTM